MTTTWLLIVWISLSSQRELPSVELARVSGFHDQLTCEESGKAVVKLMGTDQQHELGYFCLEQEVK